MANVDKLIVITIVALIALNGCMVERDIETQLPIERYDEEGCPPEMTMPIGIDGLAPA